MKELRIIVEGLVQGVFYRYNARKAADALGIRGWVKNTDDSKVEILAQGEDDALRDFVSWCRKGSSLSNVKSVEIVEEKDIDRPESPIFEIIY